MKALLLTVLIILVILVVLIYYLNPYTVKKPVVKEQFYGGGGDVYSLQSGTTEFETVTKLESDVNNVIVKQEQNTADLSAFKTDTNNQFSTLNAGFGQFKMMLVVNWVFYKKHLLLKVQPLVFMEII